MKTKNKDQKRMMKLLKRLNDVEHEIIWELQHNEDSFEQAQEKIEKLNKQKRKLQMKMLNINKNR